MNSLTQVSHVTQAASYKYHVRLASIETKEEENGDYIYLVPIKFKAIEVIVTDNSEAAIKTVVASLKLSEEYKIIGYYLPVKIEDAPF